MSLADSVRDRRTLLLRLIMAEALAKRGEGPLALRTLPSTRLRTEAVDAKPREPSGEPTR